MTFAKTIKGPLGPCHVTSQIVGFPTIFRFRSSAPPPPPPPRGFSQKNKSRSRSDPAILYQPFGRFLFPQLKLLFRNY